MITTIKNWLSGLPTWVVAAISVVAVCVGLLLFFLWLLALFSSGWVFLGTIIAVLYFIFYNAICTARKMSR